MRRYIIATILLVLAIELICVVPILLFTPPGQQLVRSIDPPPPTPTPVPAPILTADGEPPALKTSVAYLLDADTNRPLINMQGQQQYPMASTTKIMTAIIALEQPNPDKVVTINADASKEAKDNNGSNAGLAVGDKIKLIDMVYALMLPSGDDAAIAIADTISGSPTNFVKLMNSYAQKLHLTHTHFINPDGLTYYTKDNKPVPGHYTSPADMAQLTRYALKNPMFAQIVQTQTYKIPATAEHSPYTWTNTDNLLQTYPGARGIKTGFTVEAGYCLVFSATNGKHNLIGVVFQEKNEDDRFTDASTMLDWGFDLPLKPPPVIPSVTPKAQ